MSYKYSHYIPHVKEGSKHTGIDVSGGNSTFFVIAISFPSPLISLYSISGIWKRPKQERDYHRSSLQSVYFAFCTILFGRNESSRKHHRFY